MRAVTTLAHAMNLKVVAEGVETPEVWAQLEAHGCDIAQGYYISRPMAADAVPGWASTQRAQLASAAAPADAAGVVAAFRPRASDRPG